MKENKISIEINRSVSDVFSFTIDPANTTKWINEIKKEETNEWPVKVGSVYKNVDAFGKWSEYSLVKFAKDSVFELLSKDSNYHVLYTFTPISGTKSNLEYYEWVNEGILETPFSQKVLKKLKKLMETTCP